MQEAEMLPRLKTAGQALRGEVREGCTGEAPFAQRREEWVGIYQAKGHHMEKLEGVRELVVLMGEGEFGWREETEMILERYTGIRK